jgi:hypothetical protein
VIDPRFVLLAAAISLLGSFGYARDTVRGTTSPNRVTWLIWAVAPLIAFAGQLDEHVGLLVVSTFMFGFAPAVVFLASFANRQAYWRFDRLDLACGALAIVTVVAWQLSGDGTVAVVLSVVVDGLAALPTVIKAWRAPATESTNVFVSGAVSNAIALLTIDHWRPVSYLLPGYGLVLGVGLFVVIRVRTIAQA